MESKHTKGRWYVSDKIQTDKNMCPIPYYEIGSTADVTWLAIVAAGDLKEKGEAEANAAHIVKCVNNYDEMLNKLKRVNAMYGSTLEQIGIEREQSADWREVNELIERLEK